MNIWNDKELLDRLEKQRAIKRGSGILTFDCLNLKCQGDRAHCTKGELLGQARDGTLDLKVVLGGILSGTCRNCKDYDGGEEVDHYGEHLKAGVMLGIK